MMDSAGAEDPFSLKKRPQAPTILIPYESQFFCLPVEKIDVKCEFNVSTAFARLIGVWKNISTFTTDLIFVLPTKGTVTSVYVEIQERRYDTMIIPKDEAQKLAGKQKQPKNETEGPVEGKLPSSIDFNEYVPDLFRLPIQNVQPGEVVSVRVVWIEPLQFINGMYTFGLPMNLNPELLPDETRTFDDIISFSCVINSVAECTYNSRSHDVEVIQRQGNRVSLKLKGFTKESEDEEGNKTRGRSANIDFGYSLVSEEILTTLINEPKKTDNGQDEGTFLLFVTPPSVQQSENFFARNMIFLLDRSGSMTGEPYREAVRALLVALSKLNPGEIGRAHV